MMGFNCCGGGVTMMLLAGLFWIVLLVGIGVLLYALVKRWQGAPGRAGPVADDPLAVLKTRYARGEITRQQYLEMAGNLTGRKGDAQ